MKRFSVPCDFAGAKVPFNIYIGDPSDGFGPLHFQQAWLLEERGGIVPQDVLDSFQKLLVIAREHNVSYGDLCVYAMGQAAQAKQESQ